MVTLDPARVQELRDLILRARSSARWPGGNLWRAFYDEVPALCDSWLAQQEVVEAARWFLNESDGFAPSARRHAAITLGAALARLDAGSEE